MLVSSSLPDLYPPDVPGARVTARLFPFTRASLIVWRLWEVTLIAEDWMKVGSNEPKSRIQTEKQGQDETVGRYELNIFASWKQTGFLRTKVMLHHSKPTTAVIWSQYGTRSPIKISIIGGSQVFGDGADLLQVLSVGMASVKVCEWKEFLK